MALRTTTRAGLDEPAAEEEESQAAPSETEPAAPQLATVAPVVVRTATGAVDSALGSAMIGGLITLGFAGIAISANIQGVVPGFLESVYKNLPIYGGVFAGVTLACFVIGLVVGKRSAR